MPEGGRRSCRAWRRSRWPSLRRCSRRPRSRLRTERCATIRIVVVAAGCARASDLPPHVWRARFCSSKKLTSPPNMSTCLKGSSSARGRESTSVRMAASGCGVQKAHATSLSWTVVEVMRPASHARACTTLLGTQRLEINVTTPPAACDKNEPLMWNHARSRTLSIKTPASEE